MRLSTIPPVRRRRPSIAAIGSALLLVGATCPGAPITSAATVPGESYAATVTVDVDAPGRPVNRLVLGNNVQWIDGGDRLLRPGTTDFDPRALAAVKTLAPTVLRYPGGSQGDTYHWKNGIGTRAQRAQNDIFFQKNAKQPVLFGTEEFLELCRQTGAEPLITVNATTGTAAEAAEWVQAVNGTGFKSADGTKLPSVRYWEVDNEPYLKNDARPEFLIPASEYARRANEFIRAMRRADPSITIGIPMRSDTVGAIHLPQQVDKYASTVLTQVTEPFDYVAVHDAYFPFIWNPLERRSEDEIFRATMAASRAVAKDFDETRALLRRYKPGRPIKIAITEFNSLFAVTGGREGNIATLGGALYVADLLRLFAESDDVLMANFWSLSDNWYFGAISTQLPSSAEPQPRPAYRVLSAYRDVLRGRVIPTRVESPTFDSPTVGLLPAYRGTPTLATLATTEGDRVRVILINKDRSRPATVSIGSSRGTLGSPVVNVLTDEYLYNVARGRQAVAWQRAAPQETANSARAGAGAGQSVTVPPHSMAWVEFQLGGR